jgi:hypothetical protein
VKFSVFIIAAVVVPLCSAASARAQDVQCNACYMSQVTYNSYCQSYQGSWPNCQTLCDGYYCSCQRDTGARCRRGTNGDWHGFRVQDVFYLPADRPFHTAYRVTSARMTRRPA